jgi:hypothetical protein
MSLSGLLALLALVPISPERLQLSVTAAFPVPKGPGGGRSAAAAGRSFGSTT